MVQSSFGSSILIRRCVAYPIPIVPYALELQRRHQHTLGASGVHSEQSSTSAWAEDVLGNPGGLVNRLRTFDPWIVVPGGLEKEKPDHR